MIQGGGEAAEGQSEEPQSTGKRGWSSAEEGWLDVDGMRTYFRRQGCGPPLVMVHGLVGSGRNFNENIGAFADVATVYALDLVNMGRSARVRGVDAGLAATADRMARWMDAAGLEQADVAGHSHGGAVAMMLAARYPGKVRRMVLFAPANPFCELGRGLLRFYNSPLGTLFARTIPLMPRALYHIAHRRMYVDKSRATRAALEGYMEGLNRVSVDHLLGIVREWWKDMAALRKRLPEVANAPTLLIWGDRDGVVGVGSGRRLAEELGARLEILPDTGHLPFAERPEECNRIVLEWMKGSG